MEANFLEFVQIIVIIMQKESVNTWTRTSSGLFTISITISFVLITGYWPIIPLKNKMFSKIKWFVETHSLKEYNFR